MHRQFKPKKNGVPLHNFASHLHTITQLHSFDFLFFCDPHFKHLDWTGLGSVSHVTILMKLSFCPGGSGFACEEDRCLCVARAAMASLPG
jgi:hypothetical protein